MSNLVEKYYKSWIGSHPLLGNQNSVEKFYKFVKACLRYGKIFQNGRWLKHFLERDLAKKYYDPKYIEDQKRNIISLFEHLIDFQRTKFPDHLIEMKNPILVKQELRCLERINGEKVYSEEGVESIIKREFNKN
ncbi:MAG: hypothetical protein KAR32_13555 [Candidatus Omnitrophica bacterium]|nr:hypothetical protein [Candidatus Omnitrophota bacterium]